MNNMGIQKKTSIHTGIKKEKQNIGVYAQNQKKIKDELEYATNWPRAFKNLFTRLKWLNAFA